MKITTEERKVVTLLGGTEAGVCNAVTALQGSLLNEVRKEDSYFWQFKHPTIRDAFAALVAEDRELLHVYLAGTPIDKLFSEISCGDVGIEGVKVIVPLDQYDSLLLRIEEFCKNSIEKCRIVHRFLTYRCDRDFLVRYIARRANFIENLHVRSYLYAVTDVGLIARLYEFGLLPESKRLSVVAAIRDLAVNIPDSGFLRDDIRKLFKKQELDDVLDYIRQTLLPKLDNQIDNWRFNYNYNGNDDPGSFFSELKSALQDYREVYKDNDIAISEIDEAMEQIDAVIEDIRSEMPQKSDDDDFYDMSEQGCEQANSRSIFDDVDT